MPWEDLVTNGHLPPPLQNNSDSRKINRPHLASNQNSTFVLLHITRHLFGEPHSVDSLLVLYFCGLYILAQWYMRMLLTPAMGMQPAASTSHCFFTSTGPDFTAPPAPQGLHMAAYSHGLIPVRCGMDSSIGPFWLEHSPVASSKHSPPSPAQTPSFLLSFRGARPSSPSEGSLTFPLFPLYPNPI